MRVSKFFINQMKQAFQNSLPPSKKTAATMERNFYVCFCAKVYNSYSALYLHVKKKHDLYLSTKCQKHIRQEWSGNVKNIYHQFVQEQAMDIQCQSQLEEESLKEAKIIQKRNESKSSSKEIKIRNDHIREVKHEELPQSSSQFEVNEQKIKQIFKKYLEQKNRQRKLKDRGALIKDFETFILQVYKQNMKKQSRRQIEEYGTLEFIPSRMNQFFMSYEKKNAENEHFIINQLMMISDWFYNQNYCKTLVISSDLYEAFRNSSVIEKR